MSPGSDKIIHHAISKVSRQIRLLRIFSDTPTENVRCSLNVYNIDTAPAYTAISYTWGPVTPVHDITINGLKTGVRENCRIALEIARLHRNELAEYVWIDAICIDQEDLFEKNHQVKLMNEIYAKAQYVLVSFGTSCPDIDPDSLERTLSSNSYITRHAEDCENLLRLSKAPYWNRLWIVQEYLAAPNNGLYIALGDRLVSCAMIHSVLNVIARKHERATIIYSEPESLRNCREQVIRSVMAELCLNRALYRRRQQSLPELFETYRRCECEDPRDKIFGLLALVHWTTREHKLQADYTKSIFELGIECLPYGIPPLMFQQTFGVSRADEEVQHRLELLKNGRCEAGAFSTTDSFLSDLLDRRPFTATDENGQPIVRVEVEWLSVSDACTRDPKANIAPDISHGKQSMAQGTVSRINSPTSVSKLSIGTGNTEFRDIEAIWIPWKYGGVAALVRDPGQRSTYRLASVADEPFGHVAENNELSGSHRCSWFQNRVPMNLHSSGLILFGPDEELYMVVGQVDSVPNSAVHFNFSERMKLPHHIAFRHIERAQEIYKQVLGSVPWMWIYPEDAMVAVCSDSNTASFEGNFDQHFGDVSV